MDGFQVQIDELREAAAAAASAAEQVRAVQPGTGLETITKGLPGGQAAGSAPGLVSTVNDRAKGWAAEIDWWSETVADSATAYAASDTEAERAFG